MIVLKNIIMKVTVCELRNDTAGLDQDWPALIEHVAAEKSDLAVAQNAKHTYPRYVKE
jgi:hypothetical protein